MYRRVSLAITNLALSTLALSTLAVSMITASPWTLSAKSPSPRPIDFLSTQTQQDNNYNIGLCSTSPQDIIGLWHFYKYIFKGTDMPPRDPNIVLRFSFHPDGTNFLSWVNNENDLFCERMGEYVFEGCLLKEKVVWTNPANDMGCSSDPDMQVGTQNTTRLEVVDEDLHLYLSLAGDPLTYIWRRL